MVDYRKFIYNKVSKDRSIIKAIVFGSYASGLQKKDSDLDLLIIKEKAGSYLKEYPAISELFEPRKLPMDILIKSSAEYKKRLKMKDPFMLNIEKNGIIVYER